jgi:DNA-directed RNA polymerase specialized sigma24 family protein
MKTRIENWDESFLDVEDYQVERALTNGALDAIRRARRFGTDFVVEEEGKPKSLRPDETAPYEKRLLEDLDRLNRKISELQAQSGQPFSLNERPEK